MQRDRDRYRRDSRDRDYRDRSVSHSRDGKEEGSNFPSPSRSHSPMDTNATDPQKRDSKDSAGKGRRSRSRDRGR